MVVQVAHSTPVSIGITPTHGGPPVTGVPIIHHGPTPTIGYHHAPQVHVTVPHAHHSVPMANGHVNHSGNHHNGHVSVHKVGHTHVDAHHHHGNWDASGTVQSDSGHSVTGSVNHSHHSHGHHQHNSGHTTYEGKVSGPIPGTHGHGTYHGSMQTPAGGGPPISGGGMSWTW